jgi:hypothetical protein
MQPTLDFLGDRCPELRVQALRLLEEDDEFRELCEEHAECARALERLQIGGHLREQIRDEYASLQLRLQRELLRYLEEHAAAAEPRSERNRQ